MIDAPLTRRQRNFSAIDEMSPALRECVHEYGAPIVNACLQMKVIEPRCIHQLVKEIWDGARQPGQMRKPLGLLDWVLVQAGSPISAATLLRVLEDAGFVVVPRFPTVEMIDASVREVTWSDGRVTRREKHQRRLRAGLEAGARQLRPELLKPIAHARSAS